MECIEFSLDSKIFKVSGSQTQKTVMSDWNGERNVRGWLARTAVQHLESRTQGEQNQRPDLIQRCLALIWPFYWLKDWTVKIWLRLLCNMWRLWLYKLSEVTGRRRRRARAEFEKARRSLVIDATWFEDDALLYMYTCLCVSSGYAQVLILRRMWIVNDNWFTMIIHHAAGGSKQLKRYKRQSLKVDAWTAKEFKKTTFCWVNFFWRPRLFRLHSLCVTWDGTSETYLAEYTRYDDLKFYHINQTMTLFSSSETFILFAFFWWLTWLFSFRVTLINILRHPWGLYVEYFAGRGPGPQRGNRGIWSRLGHPVTTVWIWPEVLRFWQHKVEAKASALHTFRWMVVDLSFTFQSRPFLHVSFTGHFLLV